MVASTVLALAPLIVGGSALVLNEGVGRLPALGWNSWNAFHCDITESQFLTVAQKFIDLGFKDAGYEYVNIDDCWSVKSGRDSNTHRLVPDPQKFPDGINGTAAKIHGLGLKFGIYSSAGTWTCAGYPASIGYESLDAQTWAEWGVDYLKYDNCNVPQNWTDTCNYCEPSDMNPNDLVNGTCKSQSGLCPNGYDYSKSNTAKRFDLMRDALLVQDHPILYSLCEWGQANVQQWGNATGSSWRMSGDIDPSWGRIIQLLNENSFNMNNVDFWGHSDADMLEVGNGISIQESRTHFSLWAAMKSPLLIGTDLEKIGANEVAILKNKYLLAFNQDAIIGKPAAPYKWGTNPDWTWNSSFPAEYWSGASTSGTLVLMFNPYTDTRNKTADFSEIPQLRSGGSYNVIDVWTGQSLGCQTSSIEVAVQGHDTAAFLVGSPCYGEATPHVINQDVFE